MRKPRTPLLGQLILLAALSVPAFLARGAESTFSRCPYLPLNDDSRPSRQEEAELFRKLRSAIQINPWSFFDNHADFDDRYAEVVGYLAPLGGRIFLVPSKEYGEFYLPQYAIEVDRECLQISGTASEQHVRLVAKIASDADGPQIVELVTIQSLDYPNDEKESED